MTPAKTLGELAADGLIDDGWASALAPVAPRIAELGAFLRAETAAGRGYLPAGDKVLRAFNAPLDDVRVLIVGQDPYPTPGHPIGLSFAVDPHVRPVPRSLANIYRELHDDLGIAPPAHGDLTHWSRSGVMLLNRVLTVQPGAGTPLADLTKTRIRLQPVNEVAGMGPTGLPITTGAAAVVRADGTFDIAGVLPGTYQLAPIGQPAGWWPKSAMLAGVDLLDVPLEMASSDVAGVDITLSNLHSQITGQLLQPGGAPASGYFVVAFSANRAHWTPQSRRLRSVRPGTDGRFLLDDLPAGEYYLAALTDADSDDWQSREFLDQVRAAAVRITLGDGERKTQALRIGR